MYIHIICIYICSICVWFTFFLLHWSESFQYSHLPTLFLYISHILLILSSYHIIQIYQKYCFFSSDLTHNKSNIFLFCFMSFIILYIQYKHVNALNVSIYIYMYHTRTHTHAHTHV